MSNKDDLDFDKIFKSIHDDQISGKEVLVEERRSIKKYILTIVGYFLFSLFGGLLLSFTLAYIPGTTKTYDDPNDYAFEHLSVEAPEGLLILSNQDYSELEARYPLVYLVGSYNLDMVVFINLKMHEYNSSKNYEFIDFLTYDTDAKVYTFNDKFLDIINGVQSTWSESGQTSLAVLVLDKQLVDFKTLKVLTIPTQSFTTFGQNLIQILSLIIMMAAVILIFRNDLVGDIKIIWNKKIRGLSLVIMGVIYMFAGTILTSTITLLLEFIFKTSSGSIISANQLMIEYLLHSPSGFLMIIGTIILAPIVEELVFRLAIFKAIKNQVGALIVSGLVFGLVHLSAELIGVFSGSLSLASFFIGGITYIISGFVFGFIYLKSDKNIVIPIIVHMLWNAFALLMVFI